MKMKRSMTVSAAVITMILLSKTPIAFADTGSQLKSQINQTEKKRQTTLDHLQKKQNSIKANHQQQSGIVNKVQQLESRIQASNDKIHVKQNSINENQQNTKSLKNNIKTLQDQIKQRNKLIAKRARAVYMNGGSANYLQLLLNSKNFNNLVSRVVLVCNIAQQDHAILNHQVSDKQKLEKEKQALRVILDQLKNDLHNLSEMKATLKSEKAQEQTLLKQLQNKAVKMKLEATNQQEQAAQYKQQEETNKQQLSKWKAEQKRLAQQKLRLKPKPRLELKPKPKLSQS